MQIHNGSFRDAIFYALGANACHGLRRTNADKRNAVRCMLSDEEWNTWSNTAIANQCGVSHTFVNNMRSSLETVSSERTYITKHGTQATMNTANIGKLVAKPRTDASEPLEEQDDYQEYEDSEKPEEPPQSEGQKANHQLINTSISNEWYTPKPFLEAAREVMEGNPEQCQTFEGWVTHGKDMIHNLNGLMWVIGDWWNWGSHRYGERAELLRSDPDFKNFNFETCKAAGWVANKIETCRRRHAIPWSYHKEVAVLPPPKQDIILDAAIIYSLER